MIRKSYYELLLKHQTVAVPDDNIILSHGTHYLKVQLKKRYYLYRSTGSAALLVCPSLIQVILSAVPESLQCQPDQSSVLQLTQPLCPTAPAGHHHWWKKQLENFDFSTFLIQTKVKWGVDTIFQWRKHLPGRMNIPKGLKWLTSSAQI